jgi:hypothetical protein
MHFVAVWAVLLNLLAQQRMHMNLTNERVERRSGPWANLQSKMHPSVGTVHFMLNTPMEA